MPTDLNSAKHPLTQAGVGPSPASLLAGAVVAGMVLGSCQPGGRLPYAAWIAPAMLLVVIRGRRARDRALAGWLAGSVMAAVAAGEPAWHTLGSFFDLSGPSLALAWIGADQLLGAVPVALFALIAGDLRAGRPEVRAWIAGAAWIASESVRELIFPGAWLGVAATLTPWPSALQPVSIVGAVAFGGVVIGTNVLLLRAVLGPDRRRSGFAAALVITVLAGFGLDTSPMRTDHEVLAARAGPETDDGIRLRLVHGSASGGPSTARAIEQLVSDSTAAELVDLTIWPENAITAPGPINIDSVRDRIGSRPGSTHLMLGMPWIVERNSGEWASIAAAVLLDIRSGASSFVLKQHPVPIAEPRALRDSDRGPDHSMSDATHRTRFLAVRNVELGLAICYEILLESVARTHAADGAEAIVNVSNEEWFDSGGIGSAHMLSHSVLRAIETGLPVVRSTNHGHTAVIDPAGRIVARSEAGEPIETFVRSRSTEAAYVHVGRWSITIALLVGAALSARGARRPTSGDAT